MEQFALEFDLTPRRRIFSVSELNAAIRAVVRSAAVAGIEVIGFRRGFVGAVEVLSCFVPAAKIHERHALRVVILGGLHRGHRRASGTLVTDANVHLGAVLQLFAGAFESFLQSLHRTARYRRKIVAPHSSNRNEFFVRAREER